MTNKSSLNKTKLLYFTELLNILLFIFFRFQDGSWPENSFGKAFMLAECFLHSLAVDNDDIASSTLITLPNIHSLHDSLSTRKSKSLDKIVYLLVIVSNLIATEMQNKMKCRNSLFYNF